MLLINKAYEYIPDRKFHVDQLRRILMLCKEEAKCLELAFGICSEERNEASVHNHLTCEIRRHTAMKIRVLISAVFKSV
jgi:hypothetical protein